MAYITLGKFLLLVVGFLGRGGRGGGGRRGPGEKRNRNR